MDSILENLYVSRELQAILFASICSKYKITRTEVLILLLLKNNVLITATDIVNKLKIAKSHVSTSVRDLEQRGYVNSSFEGNNHRSIHLQLCDNALDIVLAGENIQNKFISILCNGFSEDELQTLKQYVQRMSLNANEYINKKASRLTDEGEQL